MLCDRDTCWLKKQARGADISTYSLKGASLPALGKTLERELPLLFGGIARSDLAGASIAFSTERGDLGSEGWRIEKTAGGYEIQSGTERGSLYGMFGLHRLLLTKGKGAFPHESAPDQSIRMVNHWDNFDGTVERGYAGASIFYESNGFRGNEGLIRQYARLLASVGVNAVSVNNVNVHCEESFFVKGERLRQIGKIAGVFAEYGIRIFLSVSFAAPVTVGGLPCADPLSPDVARWWEGAVAGIYRSIPDFAGFLVKADSEGMDGPLEYGRGHDDGANMLARALRPHGGIVIWRCFVYDCAQDWRDLGTDRARAAYDTFMRLDGRFEDNVVLQIKNGPVDFQVREPVSPLFGSLRKTGQMLEFQITQEYTGQQKDICYLIPMWKEILDFETGRGPKSAVKSVVRRNSPSAALSGIAGIANVGMDGNWTGNKLAQANIYGYGRLAWDNGLSPDEIAGEWIRLSFDLRAPDAKKLKSILASSRATYESYTCPLASGFMCKPSLHYGPDVDGYEYDRWGTYHCADRNGVGRDRTKATGTGFAALYSRERFEMYESLAACPDELLLFFHHVPYTHRLRSGKTVIQHIYDSHFRGVEAVGEYMAAWESLKPSLDEGVYLNVKGRLELQMKNAVEWRDQVNAYFYRKSGIADEMGRKIYG
ncbi:MAG: alpha-glucuronidase [Clostridiales bacterium]|nr:alpha-glucuronidase [Clostridiales bacterium]